MTVEFAVHFLIQKGLGPEMVPKTIFIGFDDIDAELSDAELKAMAKADAERSLYHSDDYRVYGKNWVYKDIERT